MKQMELGKFVRTIKMLSDDCEIRFAFFLGAGCSYSSGISMAGELVNDWLKKLKRIETGNENNVAEWAEKEFVKYKPNNPALVYPQVIERLFTNAETRQMEIEKRIGNRDPGFGYAVLAKLIAHDKYGKYFNTVLTTNFDDMVADALYLYTNKKPLVVLHESIAGFVKISRTRPLVIKLHGDARISPKNTENDTASLDEEVKKVLRKLLPEMGGLIFAGYGGNDESIYKMLSELDKSVLDGKVYWVNDKLPENGLGRWLEERNAVWVNHLDFDELMLLVRNEFGLEHPDKKRFDTLMDNYFDNFNKLKEKVEAKPDTGDKKQLEDAVQKAENEFKDWWAVEVEARKYKTTDMEKADKIYQVGIKKFPESEGLICNYAIFLHEICNDYDRAEEYYKRAIEVDPNDVINLYNYANFLNYVQKDYDKAEEYYKRAVEADPNYANNLGNYANLLKNIRKDYDSAEEYYKRAIEADSNHANNLGNYAVLLENIRKDYDSAEEYYKRAIEADSNHANNLGNYAVLLENIRKDYDSAEEYYKRAIKADPNDANNLGNYADFLEKIRKDYNKAEKYYTKSLRLNPNSSYHLRAYAKFLRDIRKDEAKANEYFKKADESKKA